MNAWKTIVLVTSLLLAGFAQAQIEIAATTSNMAMLARTVGGDAVRIRVLAPPDRNPHYLEARPSMMAALRRADLVIAVGAELEGGWLPSAVQGAANPRLRPGQRGYFEAAAQVQLIDEGLPADRRLGDVHPAGNPHVYFDPVRMVVVAEALAERLAKFAPQHAERFHANASGFRAAVEARLDGWQSLARGSRGVVLYHKDADNLTRRFGVAVLGYIEPVPGVPPTAGHLHGLLAGLQDRDAPGAIVHASYEPARGPQFLGQRLGWPVHALANSVAIDASAEDYLDLIEAWITAMSG